MKTPYSQPNQKNDTSKFDILKSLSFPAYDSSLNKQVKHVIDESISFNTLQKLISGKSTMPDLVVFSHLRWEFVLQRPQHILNRFAQQNKVLFIEEPIELNGQYGSVHNIQVSPNITVIQPRISWADWEALQKIIDKFTQKTKMEKPILWFYSPAFVEMIDRIDHSVVVFDCMDELSAFKGASKELLHQEKILLDKADVVFTGGKSLYDAKKDRHSFIHCFPSSVDRKHFEKAIESSQQFYPKDLLEIPKPIAGFYGVIDERIDLKLLDNVAKLMPAVSFVMIGPVVKINPKTLPVRDNIHYLGPKKYHELPDYLQHFTVAMMPFALNESTRFISPTKTLEFMAALKPIVSTPIYDVVRDYQKEVAIASSAEEFTQQIQQAVNETPAKKANRIALQQAVIRRTSWSNTVAEMKKRIMQALEKKPSTQNKFIETSHTVSSNKDLQLGFAYSS